MSLNPMAWPRTTLVLAAIPLVLLIAFFFVAPIPQPLDYHLFADRRGCWGVPNFGDVASNLAFLLSGAVGLVWCLTRRPPGARLSWSVFFAGVMLVRVGSPYYHWSPSNDTLVWDRLPMTIGFMAVYVALLSEYLGLEARRETWLLLPATAMGLISVVYWSLSDDLRLYFAVQAVALGSAVVMVAALSDRRQQTYLAAALASYALAIACEQHDYEILSATAGAISGHTIKHLFAALAPLWVFQMLKTRGINNAGRNAL